MKRKFVASIDNDRSSKLDSKMSVDASWASLPGAVDEHQCIDLDGSSGLKEAPLYHPRISEHDVEDVQ